MRQPLDRKIFKEIFLFNKWAFGFSAVFTVGSRLDTYLASYFTRLADVGIYGLATQSVTIVSNLVIRDQRRHRT